MILISVFKTAFLLFKVLLIYTFYKLVKIRTFNRNFKKMFRVTRSIKKTGADLKNLVDNSLFQWIS